MKNGKHIDTMANRQPKWNIYEAVILLDGYLKIQNKKEAKSCIIKHISDNLRQMAKNKYLNIDETYRNISGISLQMQSMESAYKGEKIFLPATKLFLKVVDIYKNSPGYYQELLKQARNMIEEQHTHRTEFLTWVYGNFDEKRYKWMENNILQVEQFAITYGMICEPIFDIKNTEQLVHIWSLVEKNKIFQIKYRRLMQKIKDDFFAYIDFCKHTEINPDTSCKNDNIYSKKENLISSVIKKHYQFGFRYNSIREIMRFRQFADEMGIILPDSDEELKEIILASGTVIEDKLFCKEKNFQQELVELVNEIFLTGANVIYYESLFANKQDWMTIHIVASAEILKAHLQKCIKGCYFAKNFFTKGGEKTERKAITKEIKRVWGAGQTKNIAMLSEELPFVPFENIRRVISGNDDFVFTAEGEYLFIDRFVVTKDEENNIFDFVENTCKYNGFASLNDIPITDLEEENFELPQFAIRNAVYKRILSDAFQLKGKILTKGNLKLDIISLLSKYIKGRSECTFDEICQKVMNLTGETNRHYAFQVLYNEMVRVDKILYISDDQVFFDVDKIDQILDRFVTDHFCSIRDITTFALFPICERSWNYYLLESYCYKYSKKYSLHVINFNDKNAGIIAKKDFKVNYNEMLAMALARTNIVLTEESAGKFLFETGYMAKRKFAQLRDIMNRAEILRKER